MRQESVSAFGPADKGCELDLESEQWYRLPTSAEPIQLKRWPEPVYGNARSARRSDINSLLSCPDEDHPAFFSDTSLILDDGCLYKRPLYFPVELRSQNLLVVSITGGGKTQKFMLPLLIQDFQQCIPTLTLDTKCEQYELLKQLPHRRGQLMVWSPMDASRTTHAINVLDACSDDAGKWLNAAQIFVRADSPRCTTGGDGEWFLQNAARLIAGTGMAIRQHCGKVCFADILQVLEWSFEKLKGFLQSANVPFIEAILGFMSSGSHNAETVFTTARNALRLFVNADVAATTSVSEFNLRDLVTGRKTLIIEVLPEHSAYVRPILNVFFTTLLDSACELARQFPGNRFPHGLRFNVDDFAGNVGAIPGLPARLNKMRSRNFGVTATVQTLGQIEELYGPEASAVIAGFGSKIFQSPVDVADAEYASRLSGTTTIEVAEFNEQTGTGSDVNEIRIGRTLRPHAAPLFLPGQIRLAPQHFAYDRAATCFFADQLPFQAWFRSAYDKPETRRLFAKLRKIRCRRLRRVPLLWSDSRVEMASKAFGMPSPSFTNPLGMTTQMIRSRIADVKEQVGYSTAPSSARKLIDELEQSNASHPALILRLLEEIRNRNATISDFYRVHIEIEDRNTVVLLAYLDYLLKIKETRVGSKSRKPR